MRSICFAIAFVLFIIPSINIGNAFSFEQKFIFQKISSFVDENKFLHLFGEIKNVSGKALTNIIVGASFYDVNHKLLNKFGRSAEVRTLNPNGISPFEILYYDTKSVNYVRNYTLSSTAQETEIKPQELHIEHYKPRIDILGFYYINGIVSNKGPGTATNSMVISAMYDKNGNVISIGRAMAEPVNITSHSQAAFGIAVTEKLQTYKIRNFSLIADSDQYVLLP
jgi:hypothetical protein